VLSQSLINFQSHTYIVNEMVTIEDKVRTNLDMGEKRTRQNTKDLNDAADSIPRNSWVRCPYNAMCAISLFRWHWPGAVAHYATDWRTDRGPWRAQHTPCHCGWRFLHQIYFNFPINFSL